MKESWQKGLKQANSKRKRDMVSIYADFAECVSRHLKDPLQAISEEFYRTHPDVWKDARNREQLARVVRAWVKIFFRAA